MTDQQETPAGNTTTREITEDITDLKAEQTRQAGMLDELLTIVKGGGGKQDPAPEQGQPDPAGHLDEIRQAIRDVNAEQAKEAQAARAARDAGQGKAPAKPPEPEQQPREAMQSWKSRLQKSMFGSDPK